MLEAIKYNLAHLADFRGREDRPTFWWYVLLLVIIDLVLGVAVAAPVMVGSVAGAISAAQSGASDAEVQARLLHQMSGNMATIVWLSAGIKLLITALSVAAFVRRLHDSNSSGWWAALAVVAQIAALAVALGTVGNVQETMTAMASGQAPLEQVQISRLSLLGWVAPLIVLVFGAMKSSPGANRYGEAPQTS